VKTPPFLLGATLIFWGWQSGLLIPGIIMALILESARFATLRWDTTETDFRRIANFCTLLSFTVVIYAFANNEEGGSFADLFQGAAAFHNATVTTARTATSFLRWLPLIFFLIVAAQVFSTNESMPLTAISPLLRRQRKRALKEGRPPLPERRVNLTYPYFFICLFSAGIHPNEGSPTFFWGAAILIIWALWPFRSRRFGIGIWALTIFAAIGISFASQRGVAALHGIFQTLDMRLMSRLFQPRTDPTQAVTKIGDIGELKLSGKIVLRLWPKAGEPPPTYLREASYREFKASDATWFSGSPRNEFINVISEPNQTTWLLMPLKTNTSSVKIACYLTSRSMQTGNAIGLLPLPAGSGRLENLHAYVLQKNPEGDVMAEGPGLVIFDALYGSGVTIDAPPENFSATNRDYLIPTNEIPALKSVIAEMKISDRDTENEKLAKVYGFFANNFTYSLWQKADKISPTNTPLTRFLLFSRSGHCEYFATATVLLLRELKIPARYAVGYLVHERDGSHYLVRERDAHSWCLYWDEKNKTWDNFDTTPGSWIDIEEKRASPWQWLSDFFSWIQFEIAEFRWSQGNIREYIVLALIPVLLYLLYQIIFRHGKKRRQLKLNKSDEIFSWPGLDSEFYELEKKLAQRGVPRNSGELLSDWLERALADESLADLRAPLAELLRLHYRHRFDPRGLDANERRQLTREAKTCLEKLSQRQPSAQKF
jgi:hypothetical protein